MANGNTVRNPEPTYEETQERPESYNDPHEHSPEAIPVRITKDETPEKIRAATKSSITSFKFLGTEQAPQQLLKFDERRRRAVIQGLPGFVSNNTLGNLWIGSLKQVNNGAPQFAGILVSGMSITLESASEVWCIPDGSHELSVTVLDEIYRT